jgi:hypothetical protein
MALVVAFAHARVGQMSDAAIVLDAEGLFRMGCRLSHSSVFGSKFALTIFYHALVR